jgi:hypothetical protein
MSSGLNIRDRRLRIGTALAMLSLLSACGGGGNSVSSIPPPPPAPGNPPPAHGTFDVEQTPLPSPATRRGDYDMVGRLQITQANGSSSSRLVGGGDLTMSSSRYFDDDPFQYVLNDHAGILPAGAQSISVNQPFLSWTFAVSPTESRSYENEPRGEYCCQYLGSSLTAFSENGDGTKTKVLSYDLIRGSASAQESLGGDKKLLVSLLYDIGYSYVAMGEWSWQVVDLNGSQAGDSGALLFADGDRTPASGIPLSGTATYDAHTLSDLMFSLTADFGQRSISTELSQASVFDVSGNAPFNNDGSFNIPLSGTAGPQAASGDMNGAFFGPHAEQVGGTLALDRADGSLLLQDAFVGQQHPH